MNNAARGLWAVTRGWVGRGVASALTGGGGVSSKPLRRRRPGATALNEVVAARSVLVTGASSGIGRAVALKLARAGARVVLVARSQPKLDELRAQIERDGGQACTFAADLSSGESTDALLKKLQADGTVIDVLVNNAGRSIRRGLDESSDRIHDYQRTMALNYFGSVRLILGLLPGMRARKRGHVINVSSAGVQMGTPLFSAYIASKAALDAFTRVAAGETREEGVLFTTVHMPLVRTPMIAPTAAFRELPALEPEEAADIVLRPLVTCESQLGTRIAGLVSLGYVLAPAMVESVVSFGHRLLADSTAPAVGLDSAA
jgi:short-subunit dehydrogenase